jgi:hypothetical protein
MNPTLVLQLSKTLTSGPRDALRGDAQTALSLLSGLDRFLLAMQSSHAHVVGEHLFSLLQNHTHWQLILCHLCLYTVCQSIGLISRIILYPKEKILKQYLFTFLYHRSTIGK